MADDVYTKQGVRNLDVMFSDKHQEAVRRRKEGERLARESRRREREEAFGKITVVHDLLYDDNTELREGILSVWPDAKFEPSYDGIHGRRLGVYLQTSELAWVKWLIRERWAGISFMLQFYIIEPDHMELVRLALDQERPGWRDRASTNADKER